MKTFRTAALALGLTAAALAGCAGDDKGRASGPDAAIGLQLQPSSREITRGEIVTVTANTENLLGRDADVQWTAPGGEIVTEDNGRIARVMFENPGTYTVTGRLFVDGREVRMDQVTVKVNPLR